MQHPISHRARSARLWLLPVAAALLTTALAPVAAEAQKRGTQRPPLTDSQREAMFKARRAWLLSTEEERMAILRRRFACLREADTPQKFVLCNRSKRQAMRKLVLDGREQLNATRRRVGLPDLPMPRALPPYRGDGPRRGQWGDGLDG
jgi:hypothetical protein